MGTKGDRRKIHGAKWEILCQPKSKGGLDFKDLCKFNKAMLAKQVWRLIPDTKSLFYRDFKVKYFPNCSILEAKPSTGSFARKSLLWSRDLIEKGSTWRIVVVSLSEYIKMLGYRDLKLESALLHCT